MGQVLVGTQGWNYDAWVGPFYPRGTRSADYLAVYARAFKTVEIDSTFYAIPPEHVVAQWASRVPADFVFALKMPREVTHERGLVGAWDIVGAFADRARILGPLLGPILIQLGPDFSPSRERRAVLGSFLRRLPADLRFAVEFRQASWLEPSPLPLLAEHNVALALVDGRWIPRERMLELLETPSADFAYVRWMGPDRKIEDFSAVVVDRSHELGEWALALAQLAQRVSRVHAYFNNHFQGHSPASARLLQRLLGQRAVEPEELPEQADLFGGGA